MYVQNTILFLSKSVSWNSNDHGNETIYPKGAELRFLPFSILLLFKWGHWNSISFPSFLGRDLRMGSSSVLWGKTTEDGPQLHGKSHLRTTFLSSIQSTHKELYCWQGLTNTPEEHNWSATFSVKDLDQKGEMWKNCNRKQNQKI